MIAHRRRMLLQNLIPLLHLLLLVRRCHLHRESHLSFQPLPEDHQRGERSPPEQLDLPQPIPHDLNARQMKHLLPEYRSLHDALLYLMLDHPPGLNDLQTTGIQYHGEINLQKSLLQEPYPVHVPRGCQQDFHLQIHQDRALNLQSQKSNSTGRLNQYPLIGHEINLQSGSALEMHNLLVALLLLASTQHAVVYNLPLLSVDL